jgi:hypothetical protein
MKATAAAAEAYVWVIKQPAMTAMQIAHPMDE